MALRKVQSATFSVDEDSVQQTCAANILGRRLLFDFNLLGKVCMSMQPTLVPALVGLELQLGDLLQIIFIVDAVTQHISKIPQCPLQGIGGSLLLGLFKSCGLSFAVLDVAVANILMESSITQRHADNDGQSQGDLERLWVLVDEVHLDFFDHGRPAIEAENLVGEGNAFLRSNVVDLLSRGPRACGQVLRPELFLEAGLQRGDFLSRVF